jgi:hypothetical protein
MAPESVASSGANGARLGEQRSGTGSSQEWNGEGPGRMQVTDWRNITSQNAAKLCAQIRIRDMKKYICLLAGLALLAACEQKESTVNPPAEKKESTTVINQSSPAAATKEKTDININTSPNPQ